MEPSIMKRSIIHSTTQANPSFGARCGRVMRSAIAFALLGVVSCSADLLPPNNTRAGAGSGGSAGSAGVGAPGGSLSGSAGASPLGGSAGVGLGGTPGMAGMASMAGASAGATAGGTGGRMEINPEPCPMGTVCECEDGIDNDMDGLVDWHFDLGCSARNDSTEGGVATGTIESGWTVFEKTAATEIVYVSALGNDSWDGRAPEPVGGSNGPKRTFNAALSAIRSGQPDWVLFRRGDTFEGSVNIRASGPSPSSPVVIASYGTETARPVIQGGIYTNEVPVQNLAVAHLELRDGVSSTQSVNNFLIEGCYLTGAAGIGATSGDSNHGNWAVRRNVVARSNDNALYFVNVAGLLVEQNVVYRPAMQNAGNHALYITREGNSDVVVRQNLVLVDKPQGNGLMIRPGGLAEENVVVRVGWSAIAFGACNDGSGSGCFPAVQAEARNNLILERRGENGCGIEFSAEYVASGTATNTIFADAMPDADCPPISQRSVVSEIGTVTLPSPADSTHPGMTLLGAYSTSLGGTGTTDAFFEEAILQRKFSFRQEYTAAAIIAYAAALP